MIKSVCLNGKSQINMAKDRAWHIHKKMVANNWTKNRGRSVLIMSLLALSLTLSAQSAEMSIEQILEDFENHRNIDKHFNSTTIEELRFSGVEEPKFAALNENFVTDGSQYGNLRVGLSCPHQMTRILLQSKIKN